MHNVGDRDFYALADNGIHGTLCGGVGTKLAINRRHEIPEVRRLVGTTSADT